MQFRYGVDLNFGAVSMIQFGYLLHFGLIATAALYIGVLTVFLLRSLRTQPLKVQNNNYGVKSAANLRLYRRNIMNRRFY